MMKVFLLSLLLVFGFIIAVPVTAAVIDIDNAPEPITFREAMNQDMIDDTWQVKIWNLSTDK